MISKDAAFALKKTAIEFAAADESLRQIEDPTEQTTFVQEAGTNYIVKRRAHQAAIEAAEQEIE